MTASIDGILRALRHPPFFCILSSDVADDDPDVLVALISALASHGKAEPIALTLDDVSFTEVRVDPDNAGSDGVTRFSRTSAPLQPHTDSSYSERPHELMALQCVTAAADGGESVVIPVTDILRVLDDATEAALRQPVFPFGDALRPILTGAPGDERIRYYRAQLDQGLGAGDAPLSEPHRRAVAALDQTLADLFESGPARFRLGPGDVLLLNNQKALHARTGFQQTSPRLLYRLRCHIDALAPSVSDVGVAGAAVAPPLPEATAPFDEDAVRALAASGDPKAAADLCRRRLETAPSDVRARVRLSKLLEADGEIDPALEQAGIACLETDVPTFALAHYADQLLRHGRFDEAEFVYGVLKERSPEDYVTLVSLAGLLQERGDADGARSLALEAIRANPMFRPAPASSPRPRVVQALGFETSSFQIIEYPDRTFSSAVKGGHFSLDHLLEPAAYRFDILNLYRDNADGLQLDDEAGVILNCISCPDRERPSLLALQRLLQRHPEVAVINRPTSVLKTARDVNALRLNTIDGVVFPQTERLRWDGEDATAFLDELLGLGRRFPLIVRRAGSQTGGETVLARSADEVRRFLATAAAPADYYAIDYHDLKTGDDFYQKTRVFCIDGRLYPVAHLHHTNWSVHSGDRYSVMASTPWMQDIEQAFIADPVGVLGGACYARLQKVAEIIDLDFFGIDFTVTDKGETFIFEANPAMRHNFDYADDFPYTRANLERISAAFAGLVDRKLAR